MSVSTPFTPNFFLYFFYIKIDILIFGLSYLSLVIGSISYVSGIQAEISTIIKGKNPFIIK